MEQAMQHPEVLRPMMQVMEQNPQIQQLMNANPELRQAMQDPENISRALRASRDPNLMREQMAATDRTLANIESHPEGFNALRRMYENVEVPLQNAIQNSQNSEAAANNGAAADANPFASLFGAASSSGNSDAPLPNPWAAANAGTAGASTSQAQQQNPFAGLGGSGGFGGLNIGGGMPDEATMRRQMEAIQNNPALMQMFSQTMSQIASDPNALENLRRSNPEFDAMLRQQPQIAEQMRNPEFLRALADPQTLQAMQHLQRVMGGSAAGGGLGGSPFGGMGAPPSVTPPADPETAYAAQISQLNDMGFFDPAENVRALVATNGNVSAAIERLLNGA
jgi:ubiquilin